MLLPLRSDDEEAPREKLWRSRITILGDEILEAVISEQMRLRELDENFDDDEHFDLEESRRIDEEYRERNRIFEEKYGKKMERGFT